MKKVYDSPMAEIEKLAMVSDILTKSYTEPTTKTGNDDYGNEYDDGDVPTTTPFEW